KTVAIIPALNEAVGLAKVLCEMPTGWIDDAIVVDGGSTDGTPEVARRHGARVVVQPKRGYGLACATGAAAAPDADAIVFLDADGSDAPADLPALVEPVRSDRADLVLGSRLAGSIARGAMPPHQRFGNRLAGFLIRRLYGVPLTDLSPFRCVRAYVLHALDMREMTYGWPTEMIVKAIRQGYRVVEIPVRYRPRAGGRSKISGTVRGTLLAAYFILGTTLRYAFSS
ncbi:MAG TPA: glycosyltransferase family 2 protein, partial [Anaerolineae bacterium]|nr:glycosyltransferase family 2 protein [Anaerolineae bacterium]